jgi:hypothetical protein
MSGFHNLRFALAAMLWTAGCGAILGGMPIGVAVLLVLSPAFLHSQQNKPPSPMTARESWTSSGLLVLAVAVFFAVDSFISIKAILRQPLVVGLIWVAGLAGYFLQWRRDPLRTVDGMKP